MENKLTIQAVMDEFDAEICQDCKSGNAHLEASCELNISLINPKFAKQFFKEKLEEILEQEKERHLTELSRVLNLHSNPTLEGGLDYEKGFKEVEKYETKLAQSLLSLGESK